MTIVARFYPNGEFTHGVDTSKSKKDRRHGERRYPKLAPGEHSRYLQWAETQTSNDASIDVQVEGYQFYGRTGGIFTYLCQDEQGHHLCFEGEDYVLEDVLVKEPLGRLIAKGDLTPIGLSNARILNERLESRKKCLKMTSQMARNIRNAAFLMEQRYGKDNLSFLTLTIPNVSDESLMRICANWDKAVHQFFVWLRHKLNAKNIEPSWVYCTEIQSKRLQKRHEYAPHLHILFRGRNGKKAAWGITPKEARKAWVRCIKPYCPESFDTRAIENLQRVKYSAGGYLSKYMSKGACSLPDDSNASPTANSLKTHWGGMSRNMSRAVRAATQVLRGDGLNGESARAFVLAIPRLVAKGIVKFYLPGFVKLLDRSHPTGERGLKIGYGRLDIPTYFGGLVYALIYIESLHGDLLPELA